VDITHWLPEPVIDAWRWLKYLPRRHRQRQALLDLPNRQHRKIVIGSSATGFNDWISTDKDTLNLLDPASWRQYVQAGTIDAILAEHVWEHLTSGQATIAAKTCFEFLRPGGHLRIAVPDGFHPDPAYIDSVKPGGSGRGSLDHKVLYTHESLAMIFSSAGYETRLLEYFDRDGKFHKTEWNTEDGMISRSLLNDKRNVDGKPVYTSIILDAIKPDR